MNYDDHLPLLIRLGLHGRANGTEGAESSSIVLQCIEKEKKNLFVQFTPLLMKHSNWFHCLLLLIKIKIIITNWANKWDCFFILEFLFARISHCRKCTKHNLFICIATTFLTEVNQMRGIEFCENNFFSSFQQGTFYGIFSEQKPHADSLGISL